MIKRCLDLGIGKTAGIYTVILAKTGYLLHAISIDRADWLAEEPSRAKWWIFGGANLT